MAYEVDTADGRCLYRGDDLALACEIHDQLPTAHLRVVPAPRPRPAASHGPRWEVPAPRAPR
jgi:hypothetical protein